MGHLYHGYVKKQEGNTRITLPFGDGLHMFTHVEPPPLGMV
jgi:hypothetical protein